MDTPQHQHPADAADAVDTISPPDPALGAWIIPARVLRLGDGSYRIIPGRPVHRVDIAECVRITGLAAKVLNRLADCGFIRRARPSPGKSYFYPAEVETFIRATESDPDYWTRVRRHAYMTGQTLRDADPQ